MCNRPTVQLGMGCVATVAFEYSPNSFLEPCVGRLKFRTVLHTDIGHLVSTQRASQSDYGGQKRILANLVL